MENISNQETGLQNVDNVPALLSQSMEVVNGVHTSCASPTESNWWGNQSSPVAATSQEYLSFSSSYTFSSEPPIASSQSAIYTSPYPWENSSMYSSTGSIAAAAAVPSPQSYTGRNVSLSPVQQEYHSRSPVQQEYHSRSISPQGFPNQDVGQLQAFPSPPPYPYPVFSNGVPASNYHSYSVDDSPISSPESLDYTTGVPNGVPITMPQVIPSCFVPPQPISTNVGVVKFSSYSTTNLGYPRPIALQADSKVVAKPQIRMPQRKGGIQLWQFLYALLSSKQHTNLMEWTSNRGSHEFRMLEPESIAVWWGTIKSKPTMTYDKFSRSLRYYYHKGILKKIQGERYMYRFLVDPEDMYRHIGSTDKRPDLKNMPKEAKMAMGIFHKSGQSKCDQAPIITKAPEGLPVLKRNIKQELPSQSVKIEGFGLDFNNSNNTACANAGSLFPMLDSSMPTVPIFIPAW